LRALGRELLHLDVCAPDDQVGSRPSATLVALAWAATPPAYFATNAGALAAGGIVVLTDAAVRPGVVAPPGAAGLRALRRAAPPALDLLLVPLLPPVQGFLGVPFGYVLLPVLQTR
jgi:hypothetical protein